jgi:hypothetical protein
MKGSAVIVIERAVQEKNRVNRDADLPELPPELMKGIRAEASSQ